MENKVEIKKVNFFWHYIVDQFLSEMFSKDEIEKVKKYSPELGEKLEEISRKIIEVNELLKELNDKSYP